MLLRTHVASTGRPGYTTASFGTAVRFNPELKTFIWTLADPYTFWPSGWLAVTVIWSRRLSLAVLFSRSVSDFPGSRILIWPIRPNESDTVILDKRLFPAFSTSTEREI